MRRSFRTVFAIAVLGIAGLLTAGARTAAGDVSKIYPTFDLVASSGFFSPSQERTYCSIPCLATISDTTNQYPFGNPDGDPFTWSIAFEVVQNSPYPDPPPDLTGLAPGASVTHLYTVPNTYQPIMTVEQTGRQTATGNFEVNIPVTRVSLRAKLKPVRRGCKFTTWLSYLSPSPHIATANFYVPSFPYGTKRATRSAAYIEKEVTFHLAGSNQLQTHRAVDLIPRRAIRKETKHRRAIKPSVFWSITDTSGKQVAFEKQLKRKKLGRCWKAALR